MGESEMKLEITYYTFNLIINHSGQFFFFRNVKLSNWKRSITENPYQRTSEVNQSYTQVGIAINRQLVMFKAVPTRTHTHQTTRNKKEQPMLASHVINSS
jgi:hypothetical protein